MKNSIKNLIAALIFFGLFLGIVEYLSAGEKDTGLLLAKSIYGECGIDCSETERAIIFNIYLKRQAITGWKLHKVISRYSGAVKNRSHHPNRWVLFLNRDAIKPKHWPLKASWRNHKQKWIGLLQWADSAILNGIDDPCPECQHYCGRFERHIASKSLRVVKLGLRNLYFERVKL